MERRGGKTGETRPEIIGDGLAQCVERVRNLARHNLPMLLVGPTGTGKELLAREYAGIWCEKQSKPLRNFVPLNCAGFTDELQQSELFGYKRGAFTGARRSPRS